MSDTAGNNVTVKLNPFSTSEPKSWFRRAEGRFRLSRITNSATMSDYVIQALPEDVFREISSWLDDQPDEIEYDKLKARLLLDYTLSPSEKAQKILCLASQPLGEQTAKQAWNEILSLSRLNEVDAVTKAPKEIDLRREILLQRLPASVRAALPEADDVSIDQLVEKADKLLLSTKASRRSHVNLVTDASSEDNLHVNSVATGRRSTPQRQSKRQKAPCEVKSRAAGETNKLQILTSSGLCGYHSRFGENAHRCVPGCLWNQLQTLVSKNGDGGRA